MSGACDRAAMPRRNGEGIALLADPVRRRLIAELAVWPRRPSVLAAILGLSRWTVSRQLRLLLDADIVQAHPGIYDRREVTYSLNPRRHGQVTAWLAGTSVAVEPGTIEFYRRVARAPSAPIDRRVAPAPSAPIDRRAEESAAKPDPAVVADNRNDVGAD
jgi:DNA-binding transcriptional ArsR family regulator